jgi:hypothetical protein
LIAQRITDLFQLTWRHAINIDHHCTARLSMGFLRKNILARSLAGRRSGTFLAYLPEQERLRHQREVDAFIEKKADELGRLQKILSFRDYILKIIQAKTQMRHAQAWKRRSFKPRAT